MFAPGGKERGEGAERGGDGDREIGFIYDDDDDDDGFIGVLFL